MKIDRCVVLIASVWILLAILANPIGDFPLNDDWAYGWTVQVLLETGRFQLSDWTATNLVSQALWGALYCVPAGFSFTALRLSTLALGLLGVLATYGLLRESHAGKGIAVYGALLVALNPLYFGLAHSFNTDVPSFAMAVTSLYLLMRGLKHDTTAEIVAGVAVALISTLNRQSGILVLPAFGLALLVKRGLSVRTALLAALPTACGFIVNALYARWLELHGETPVLFGLQIRHLVATLSSGLAHASTTYARNAATMGIYLGLFLAPFTIAGLGPYFRGLSARSRRTLVGITVVGAAVGVACVGGGRSMPLAGNILGRFGLGPQPLKGAGLLFGAGAHPVIAAIWGILTIVGAVGAAILAFRIAAALLAMRGGPEARRSERSAMLTLHLAVVALYLGAIAGLEEGYWFDRYLIFPLPMLMASVSLVAGQSGDLCLHVRKNLPAWSALMLLGAFSVAVTHDYLAWNRARWRALDELTQNGEVPPARIDGGFEFNGWQAGNRLETCAPAFAGYAGRSQVGWDDFTCLWGDPRGDRVLAIAFAPQPGYEIANERPYRRWLPWRLDRIYVLRRRAQRRGVGRRR